MFNQRIDIAAFLAILSLTLSINSACELFISPLSVQAQTTNDRKAEADQLLKQGIEQYQHGQLENALQSWQQALSIYQAIHDRQKEGQALGNVGIAYGSLGQYDRAIEYFQQRLTIAREIKDREGEGAALGNVGNAYRSLGQYDKSIEAHQQALIIVREIKDRWAEGPVLGSLGITYGDLGQYDKSIEYLQQSLAIAREIKDRKGEGQTLGNLGNVYKVLGNYAKAIEYHQQALSIDRDIKDQLGEGQDLGNLGNAYGELGQYAKAIDYYQQALTIMRQIKDREGEGTVLGNLGSTYSDLGQFGRAVKYQQQALAILREIKDRPGEGNALNNLGWTLYRSGKLAAAEQALRQSIAVYESFHQGLPETDQITLLDSQQNPYLNLQQVKVALKKPEEALEIAERGRARAFAQRLCQRYTPISSPCTIQPISVQKIQQVAQRQNATLVEYSLIANNKSPQLYIWVVQPSGTITFHSAPLTLVDTAFANVATRPRQAGPDRGEVVKASAERIRGTLNAIGATGRNGKPTPPDPVQERKYLQAFYKQLIQPIVGLLPKDANRPVIFIPQGPFFQVPFAALQDASGISLIDHYTILSAPSIQSLALILKQPSKGASVMQNALVVGNPAVTSVTLEPGQPLESLDPLPGAETEARKVASFYFTQPLIGAKATKAVVMQQMPQADLIHLATHGFLDDVRRVGVPGAIALTPDRNPQSDGLLTADEIISMRLKAQLVVLSACDTGGGKITGDGVVGLSRSFMAAGAPNVIVSLWKVPDEPTAMLMKEFYQQWRAKPEKGKAWALRAAMRATKQQYPEPLAWAAFTLIGVAK